MAPLPQPNTFPPSILPNEKALPLLALFPLIIAFWFKSGSCFSTIAKTTTPQVSPPNGNGAISQEAERQIDAAVFGWGGAGITTFVCMMT
jgi:hypothetical protein